MIDLLTACVFYGIWPVFLILECVILAMRGEAITTATISMIARDRAWHIGCVTYVWCGLAAHWWIPGARTATVAGSIVFWLIVVGLIVQDVWLWNSTVSDWPRWLLWQRFPAIWVFVGLLFGWALFPQVGKVPWK